LVRREGLRIPSGDAEHTVAKLLVLPLPPHVLDELAPLVALWAPLDAEIAAADGRLLALAKDHPAVARLRTMPSIEPVRAIAFAASLDDVTRFHSAHQVQAYLGLGGRNSMLRLGHTSAELRPRQHDRWQ
jgi:transposase